jgi:hypothetical protein
LATASWQPFQHHELKHIYQGHYDSHFLEEERLRHMKLQDAQIRKRLKKKEY